MTKPGLTHRLLLLKGHHSTSADDASLPGSTREWHRQAAADISEAVAELRASRKPEAA